MFSGAASAIAATLAVCSVYAGKDLRSCRVSVNINIAAVNQVSIVE